MAQCTESLEYLARFADLDSMMEYVRRAQCHLPTDDADYVNGGYDTLAQALEELEYARPESAKYDNQIENPADYVKRILQFARTNRNFIQFYAERRRNLVIGELREALEELGEEDTPVCSRCECVEDECECFHCEHCGESCETICARCNNCESHCECAHCRHCGPVESACGNCERCTECCECSYCNSCGENVSSGNFCCECERCTDCCSCEKEDEGPRLKQKLIFEEAPRASRRKNTLARLISMELELSQVEDADALIQWARSAGAGLDEDGSIPNSGCEIKTNPASGDIFIRRIEEMASALDEASADIDSSCGLHVHVDARDYSQWDVRRAIMLWSVVERTFFDLAGKARISNDYCKPASNYYAPLLAEISEKNWRQKLASRLYEVEGRKIPDKKADHYHRCRYHSLNIHTFFQRKTLEFRLHEATLDKDTLIHWPILCAHVIDYAFRHTEKELLAMIKGPLSSREALQSFLPSYLNVWIDSVLEKRHAARARYDTSSQYTKALDLIDNGRKILASETITGETKKTKKPRVHKQKEKPIESGTTAYQDINGIWRIRYIDNIPVVIESNPNMEAI